jgi:hypothetical protein
MFCFASVLAACSGEDETDKADCPTSTPGQPTATTTVDPRCVVRATETSPTGDEAATQTWKGTINTTEGGPGMSGTTAGTFSVTVGPDGAVSGSGSSHSEYSNAAPIDSQITVTGKRVGDSFQLVIALNPGTRIDAVASIHGTTAEAPIDLTGEAGTYSRGAVRLECQDCG